MKKTTKGAIAAGAAALLLAGGAGTMAAWTATAPADNADITAGSLSIDQRNPIGEWKWATPGVVAGTTFNPEDDKLAPGDSVTYTGTYDVKLVGKNLKAGIDADLDGVSASRGGFGQYLSLSNTDFSAVRVGGGTANATELTEGDYVVKVSATATFADEADNDTMNAQASLSGASIVLKQTAPAVAP